MSGGSQCIVCPLTGKQEWRDDEGQLHRDDGPAIIYTNGTVAYYKHGTQHREDGPAVVRDDGSKEWVKNGFLHRKDGPAYLCGTIEEWYLNDLRHRDDGPAIIDESEGVKSWFKHGKLHRGDGPAFIGKNGYVEWVIDDIDISHQVSAWMNECGINPNWEKWTDSEKILFKLRFA